MRAILLAAGLGTRLRPLTNSVPKCLMPIKGKPLLEIWLEQLTNSGVSSILINTHYLAPYVDSFIKRSPYRDSVTLVNEEKLLGTAGTLMANLNFFEDEGGLLIHADNYCLANFEEFIRKHANRPKKCLMTMMTFRTNAPSTCGIVELDGNEIVIGFHEKVKNPPGNLANGAIYALSSEMVESIKKQDNLKDFSEEIIPSYLGRIYSYETHEALIDIGTYESYKRANNSK